MKLYPMTLVHGLASACAASLLLTACNNRQEEPRTQAASTATPPVTTVGTEIDDSLITTRVKSALLADPDVKSFDIKVETRKGQVQLSGFVDTQARIDSVLAITRKVEGVKGVENGMSLQDGPTTAGSAIDDGILLAKIKSALLADANIKSIDIAVVVRKGTVQLSGYVDNQEQIKRALDIVHRVQGVQDIRNEMSLKK